MSLYKRLHEVQGQDDAARIRRAFLTVYGRPARDLEVELGLQFLGLNFHSRV